VWGALHLSFLLRLPRREHAAVLGLFSYAFKEKFESVKDHLREGDILIAGVALRLLQHLGGERNAFGFPFPVRVNLGHGHGSRLCQSGRIPECFMRPRPTKTISMVDVGAYKNFLAKFTVRCQFLPNTCCPMPLSLSQLLRIFANMEM